MNGPGNFAPSSYTDNGTSIVNARVIGHAIFADGLGANLEFAGYVGSGVSAYLNLNSTIVIDSPKEFHGTIGDMEQTNSQGRAIRRVCRTEGTGFSHGVHTLSQ